MVQEEAAAGPEQEIHPIHPAMHTQKKEEQVPIAQKEESHQEEGSWATIQAMAASIHLDCHHQVHQAVAELRQLHLHRHLQGIEQLTHGHRSTGL